MVLDCDSRLGRFGFRGGVILLTCIRNSWLTPPAMCRPLLPSYTHLSHVAKDIVVGSAHSGTGARDTLIYHNVLQYAIMYMNILC